MAAMDSTDIFPRTALLPVRHAELFYSFAKYIGGLTWQISSASARVRRCWPAPAARERISIGVSDILKGTSDLYLQLVVTTKYEFAH